MLAGKAHKLGKIVLEMETHEPLNKAIIHERGAYGQRNLKFRPCTSHTSLHRMPSVNRFRWLLSEHVQPVGPAVPELDKGSPIFAECGFFRQGANQDH